MNILEKKKKISKNQQKINSIKKNGKSAQNKRMNEYNGISATKIVQIYKHTFFKILLTG